MNNGDSKAMLSSAERAKLNQIMVDVELGLSPQEEVSYLEKYHKLKTLIHYNSHIDLLVLTRLIIEFRERMGK